MNKSHFSFRNSAEIPSMDFTESADPFSENPRSKTQEHTNRFLEAEKFQKIVKIEENSR